MKLKELRKKIIGRKLMSIIVLEPTPYILNSIKAITGEEYGDTIDSLQLLVFEDNIELIYSDFDSDGYRSGQWYLSILSDVLDKGATKEIKKVNSIVRDIIYLEENDKEYFMITTDEYVIMMGQDNSDSYYPRNFFSHEETKEKAISDLKNIEGENIEH